MASILVIQHCLVICILTMRDDQTRKQFQAMGSSTYFQSLFTKLFIALDCFTTDKDSIMQSIYNPGFSVENKNNILSVSDIKTVREMYGAAKHVIVTAIFNSNKAKVMIKNIKKDSRTQRQKGLK